jgi:CBS domain-containing protein
MAKVHELLAAKRAAIHAIEPEQPVLAAIQAMADHGVGALLVMRGGDLLGIVSERDYARKVILKGRSSAETPVWEIMSHPVHTVTPDASVATCMMLMTDKRIRHLPVVDEGRVVGVLSIGDLVRSVIEAQEREIAELQRYIAG